MKLSATEIRKAVDLALSEDIGDGDATTLATIPEDATARAIMRVREPVVVAGLAFAEAAFCGASTEVKVEVSVHDGEHIKEADSLLSVAELEKKLGVSSKTER